MALELGASRMLAPFLGSSIHTWTSLIGVILASLSAGYWWGGKYADRNPHRSRLALLLLIAAGSIGTIPVFEYPLLSFLSQRAVDLRVLTLIAGVLLFALPSFLLGTVAPYAVRLSLTDVGTSGAQVGALYAWSTAGSIFGTFLTGYFLFAVLGTSQLMIVLAGAVCVLAIVLAAADKLAAKLTLVMMCFVISYLHRDFVKRLEDGGLFALDTAYHRVLILDSQSETKRPLRSLVTDPLGSQSMMFRDAPAELAGSYSKYYDLGFWMRPAAKRALLIGGGAYSYPKHVQEKWPDVHLDVVELDPGMTQIARTFFEYKDSSNVHIFHEDARTFIQRANSGSSSEPYDLIFLDAFASSPSIPFQLVTQEFIAMMRARLAPDGILAINLIGAAEGPQGVFLRALKATADQVFSTIEFFAVSNPDQGARVQNFILMAANRPFEFGGAASPEQVQPLLAHLYTKPIATDVPPLRDNFAPVEQYLQPVLLTLQQQEKSQT